MSGFPKQEDLLSAASVGDFLWQHRLVIGCSGLIAFKTDEDTIAFTRSDSRLCELSIEDFDFYNIASKHTVSGRPANEDLFPAIPMLWDNTVVLLAVNENTVSPLARKNNTFYSSYAKSLLGEKVKCVSAASDFSRNAFISSEGRGAYAAGQSWKEALCRLEALEMECAVFCQSKTD